MRWLVLVVVVLVFTGCGKNRPSGHWPAVIVGYEGFSDAELVKVRAALAKLNEVSGKIVVSEAKNVENPFPIKVTKVTPPSNNKDRAGLATMDYESCLIELSDFIFTSTMADYVDSVFIHEVGHCGGLEHNPTRGSIMFETTERWARYTSDALSQFSHDFLSVLW